MEYESCVRASGLFFSCYIGNNKVKMQTRYTNKFLQNKTKMIGILALIQIMCINIYFLPNIAECLRAKEIHG